MADRRRCCAVTTFAHPRVRPVQRRRARRSARAPTACSSLLPAALLAALVVTETVIHDGDARHRRPAGGVAAAGVLLWRGASVVWVVIGAAAMTALLRLLF